MAHRDRRLGGSLALPTGFGATYTRGMSESSESGAGESKHGRLFVFAAALLWSTNGLFVKSDFFKNHKRVIERCNQWRGHAASQWGQRHGMGQRCSDSSGCFLGNLWAVAPEHFSRIDANQTAVPRLLKT